MGKSDKVQKKEHFMSEKTKILIAKFFFGCIPCLGISVMLRSMYGLYWADMFSLFAMFVNAWAIVLIAFSD